MFVFFTVKEGRIQCPYHGWEYSTDGNCTKMPSTKLLNVKIKSIPCLEQDGMVWVWPGDEPPLEVLSCFSKKVNKHGVDEDVLHTARCSFPLASSLDFAPILKNLPFMEHLWRHFAEQVLNEDLRLVLVTKLGTLQPFAKVDV